MEKRWIKGNLRSLTVIFVMMNVVALFQVCRFTHFIYTLSKNNNPDLTE